MIDAGSMELPVWLNVSRETHDRLRGHLELVARWNPAINLVARGSLAGGWERHVLDSAQIFDLVEVKSGIWADLGSGAGFPGLVVAILAAERAPDVRFVLIEADRRKATFLAQAARLAGVDVEILCARAENLAPIGADVLTARAFAPLDQLCGHVARHLSSEGVAVLHKGSGHDAEIAIAARTWSFDRQLIASRTDPAAGVLMMRNIRHV
jgi:16S rRNA (guanine527-N7)-methyltransferase